ncbi:hypothetical protein A9Q87_11070 [Flavobacteriales bacterium 34_180_T64]|nr:hypothetical protein A9Q87_11070 [Flavobacteriales bacterium 34_180_T64]
MNKKCLIILLGVLALFSCASNDEYVALDIETTPDNIQVAQGSSIEIDVLNNDTNIPNEGLLSVSNSQNAMIVILDTNNTPSNPSDDTVRYTPNLNFYGQDSFTYTICNNANPQDCNTETVNITVQPVSPVNFDLAEVPYQTLSEYNFFEGALNNLTPVFSVIPYDLNSPLFSDYAHKKRFVWLPSNEKANYVSDYTPLDFPVGAVLIKNFYYDNVQPSNETKILETRLMFRTEDGWDFAKYVWNEDQTEATFTDDGSFVAFDWIENGVLKSVNYRIPSRNECFTCHNKFGTPVPIGPKPQNLNKNYNYALGDMNQLSKWIELGFLEDNLPSNIITTVKWDDEAQPLDLRVRSYIDINCAHCHSEQSYCEYRPMRFAYNENDDLTNMGVCVSPDTQIESYTKIIVPNDIDKSILHFRISSTAEQFRMPLLGRTLQHQEGVRLIEEWINSLTTNCE